MEISSVRSVLHSYPLKTVGRLIHDDGIISEHSFLRDVAGQLRSDEAVS